MWRQAWLIIFAIVAVAIILLLLVETRQYRTGRSLVTRRQFVIRLIGGALMLSLVGALFLAICVFQLTSGPPRPVAVAVFFFVCLVLLFALMFMAVADARAVEKRQGEAEGRLWRDFLLQLARLEKGKTDQPSTPAEDNGQAQSRPGDDASGNPPGGTGSRQDQS